VHVHQDEVGSQPLELGERVLAAAGLADQGHIADFLQIRFGHRPKGGDVVDQQHPQRKLNFDAAYNHDKQFCLRGPSSPLGAPPGSS
jgi:hypothetical protein